jgi:hypothetical protein
MALESVEAAFDGSTLVARIRAGIPQGQAKRQHFTPQLLLRRFLVPGATHLCQLDVKTGRPQMMSVQAAASRRRFYTLHDTETGVRDEVIEGLLSLIEDAAASALETVLSTPTNVTADERVTLSYFTSAQLVRTPAALERMQAIRRVHYTAEMARLIVDDATFATGYAAVRDHKSGEDHTWLQEWMREALLDDRVRITNERELGLSTMVDLLDDFAVRLYLMPWSLLEGTRESFITSDSGLGVIDSERDRFPQVTVLGSRAARLLMPMARKRCLQIGPQGYAPAGITGAELDRRDVLLVNLGVYGWAQRHIFAESQHAAEEMRKAAKTSPRAVSRPQPFRQHVLIERDPHDDSLAKGHRKTGRAPYINHLGETFDYVILRDDKSLPGEALRALALSKARASRRKGTTDLRSGTEILSPLDVRRVPRDD